MVKKVNLNEYRLENDGNFRGNLKDNSIIDEKDKIQVFFRNIVESLINEINKADVIVGCVAWLTHPDVLEALSKKMVSLIIQKEDFLRPDTNEGIKKWKQILRERYNTLDLGLDRLTFTNNILHKISFCGNPLLDPIRCVGCNNKNKAPAFPRMHNKFLIFAKLKEKVDKFGDKYNKIMPYAVWTGSFNLTKTATNSLENALIIKDRKIVNAYFKEYGQICAMSEPLDWESDYIEPEWRIGS